MRYMQQEVVFAVERTTFYRKGDGDTSSELYLRWEQALFLQLQKSNMYVLVIQPPLPT